MAHSSSSKTFTDRQQKSPEHSVGAFPYSILKDALNVLILKMQLHIDKNLLDRDRLFQQALRFIHRYHPVFDEDIVLRYQHRKTLAQGNNALIDATFVI